MENLQCDQIDAVTRLPEVIIDPDNEPLNDEDRRAVAASREYFRLNPQQSVSFEELLPECGFTMDQIRCHKEFAHRPKRVHNNLAQ